MTCDVQSILDEAECFYELNDRNLLVAIAALWCEVAENFPP